LHSAKISLKQFGLTEYFEILGTGKPEGPYKINGIRRVLNRLNVSLDESIYVGDAPGDIRYCKEIGIKIAAAWAATTDSKEL
jgi:phosphoglycolate phosphatase/pyrophosphatase PpaX